MSKLIVTLIAITLCAPCYAAPKKTDATKWLSEFRTAHDKTGDALFLNDPIKRRNHTQDLMKLRDRAEKLFNQPSDYQFNVCALAASGLVSMWGDEIELVRGSSYPHITASGLANIAWESGQNYGTCRDLIDTMK